MIIYFNFGQMYKVFFNDRIIFIGRTFKNSRLDNSLYFEVSNPHEAVMAWESFLNDAFNRDMFIEVDNPDSNKDFFFGLFTNIVAAGGVVVNNDKGLLCIFRWGKWDLPKGKSEKDENPEETAIREVEEECGISGVVNSGFNSITYHIYEHPRKTGLWILKHTYWYNMNYSGEEKLVPQIKEEIVDARWFSKSELGEVLSNTWASLQPIIEQVISSDSI
jgi:8-oxo-dGTP pyrophosphatase MutT (NUDIX family)